MAFSFRLVHADGPPADPATFTTVAPNWRPDDVIPLGRRSLRVVEVLAGEPTVLIVEDAAA